MVAWRRNAGTADLDAVEEYLDEVLADLHRATEQLQSDAEFFPFITGTASDDEVGRASSEREPGDAPSAGT